MDDASSKSDLGAEKPGISRRSMLMGTAGALVSAGVLLNHSPAYAAPVPMAGSGDAYASYDAATGRWVIGTATISKTLELQSQFRMISLIHVPTGRDFVAGSLDSFEFMFTYNGTLVGAGSGGWSLHSNNATVLPNGGVELVIVLDREDVRVSRTYTAFPETGVISEFTAVTNRGTAGATLTNPTLFYQSLSPTIADTDFSYLTGGGNFTGSGVLKTVALTSSYQRRFDSKGTPETMTVDGNTYNAIGTLENGTGVYDTFFLVRDRASTDALWLTFDYNGHWQTTVGPPGFSIVTDAVLPGLTIGANETIDLPKATYGVAAGDLDDIGNAVGTYTYTYLWDYTRNLGGGTWQWRAAPQVPSAFESINYNRYLGGHTVHIDEGWFGKKGDWTESVASDDFAALSAYARKSGFRLKVWMPFWHVDKGSAVHDAHPGWLASSTIGFYGLPLNLANPAARAWMVQKAIAKQAEWGGYRWRYDGLPSFPSNNGNDMLAQSAGFLSMLKSVKDAVPEAEIDGCASGGETLLMEAVRYSDSQQLTDGAAYHYAGYYQSLKLPIDKLAHAFYSEPDIDTNFSVTTDKTPAVAEKTRRFYEVHRWLATQGVVGRWVKVFRPLLASGDHTFMLQRSSGDQLKSYISFSAFAPYFGQPIRVYPKGLVPTAKYSLRLYKTPSVTRSDTGANWVQNGVLISDLKEGEMIFFNLDGYPGSGTQTTAPAAPVTARKTLSTYLGKEGTEITWGMPPQSVWVSYVEIQRNGMNIDKVSTGSFWFVPGLASSDTYAIRTVTGDGAASAWVTATFAPGGVSGAPAVVPPPPVSSQLSTDFSMTQGQNNWAYLQRDSELSSMLYVTTMTPESANGRWVGNSPFALIYPGAQHPQAPYESVVKWFAPAAGNVRITGHVSRPNHGQGGDGVTATILRGSAIPVSLPVSPLWQENIGANDSVGKSHDLTIAVTTHEPIYFIVHQDGDAYFDMTGWDPRIEYV